MRETGSRLCKPSVCEWEHIQYVAKYAYRCVLAPSLIYWGIVQRARAPFAVVTTTLTPHNSARTNGNDVATRGIHGKHTHARKIYSTVQ